MEKGKDRKMRARVPANGPGRGVRTEILQPPPMPPISPIPPMPPAADVVAAAADPVAVGAMLMVMSILCMSMLGCSERWFALCQGTMNGL